jgi:hypothetical protein
MCLFSVMVIAMVRCEFVGMDGKRCSRKAISKVRDKALCQKHFSRRCEEIYREQRKGKTE